MLLLTVLFLPLLFFCQFVYGVLPMIALCALAVYGFHRVSAGRKSFAPLWILMPALAGVVKPNAAVPLIALTIGALLLALRDGNPKLLLWAALSCALFLLLPRAVILLYEHRSGIRMEGRITMLARLAMGLQDSPIAPGWINGFTERFFSAGISRAEQFRLSSEAIRSRLGSWPAGEALAFFRNKFLTQWTEPSYETLWYGAVASCEGRFNGLGNLLYRDGTSLHLALLACMNAFQQAMLVLALVGSLSRPRRIDGLLILEISVLGGFLYHMLFEAKAQYILVYAVFLLPLAAAGLERTAAALSRLRPRSGLRRAAPRDARPGAFPPS